MRVHPSKSTDSSIAHSISIGPHIINLRKSANAWWMDHVKVYRIMSGFEAGATIEEACHHAGITKKQYKYFALLHPEIHEIRQALISIPIMHAKRTLALNLDNPKVAMRFLARMEPETFGRPSRQVPRNDTTTFRGWGY